MRINLNIGLGTLIFGDTVTERKYFHQILLNLEHMEIYAAVHFTRYQP
jgi:hypothetical protein